MEDIYTHFFTSDTLKNDNVVKNFMFIKSISICSHK